MARERAESGQFVETVTLEDVLAVFDAVRGPVITSSDVAEALECTTEAARQKLTRLYDQGKVDKRKTGRTVVYWRTEDVDATPARAATQRREEPPEATPGETDTSPEEPRETAQEDIHAAVEALDLQGSGTVLEARQDALAGIVNKLREEGSATAAELKALVDPEAVGYESADSFWANIRSQNVFEDLPVETPGRGGRRYTYAEK